MRVREEETAARLLDEARHELSFCLDHLQRAKRERLDYNESTCAESAKGVSGQRLLEKRAISEMIKRTIEMSERQSLVLGEKVGKRQAEWFARRKARRVLDNLHDRGFRKWREDFEREEQKMTDEMASNRYNWHRRQKGGVIGWVLLLILVAALGAGAWYGARIAGRRDVPSLGKPNGTVLSDKTGRKGPDGSASGGVANATAETGMDGRS
jgi:flagellar export protein FliJ